MSAFDINVKVTVEAPAIVEAINRLCDRSILPVQAVQAAPAVNPPAPAQTATQAPAQTATQAPVEAPQAVPAQNVVNFPAANPAPAQAPVEAPQAVPAPPAEKPIDLDTISRAGAALIDQGKMPQVLGVLKEFGVEAITQLQPSTYPAFAERLKALGAIL